MSTCYRIFSVIIVLSLLAASFILTPRAARADVGYQNQTTVTAGTNVTQITVNVPSGTMVGDLLLFVVATDGNPTISTPTGLTSINQGAANGNAARLAVYRRIADGTEPASYTFTWTGGQNAVGAALRYSGIDTATPLNPAAAVTGTGASTTPTAPSATTTVNEVMVIRIVGVDEQAITAGPGVLRVNLNSGGTAGDRVSLGISEARYPIAGNTDAQAFTIGASDDWRGVTIGLRPAANVDWGDAPDGYGTLRTTTSNGPRHVIVANLRLGATADAETNGQPGPTAGGDGADEDGIASFPTLTSAMGGQTYNVTVAVNNTAGIGTATLRGWIDFDRNGTFDSDESASASVPNGTNGNVVLAFTVPADVTAGPTYARFRISTNPLAATDTGGIRNNGEVEDYRLSIEQSGSIRGVVFRDFDADGARDYREVGLYNITVTAYDATGAAVASTTTDSNGNYALTGLTDGVQYRIEVTGLPDYLRPGFSGADCKTTVMFATSPGSGFDVGAASPGDYCQSNPNLALPIFIEGDNTGSTEPEVVRYPYSTSGTATKTTLAQAGQVGTVYGLAYQRASGILFASAYVKRGAGLGPSNSTGAIYRMDGTNATLFLDLNALGFNTGPNPHPNGMSASWIADAETFSAVGKVGLGDLDISDDGLTLYTINLYNKELLVIPLGSATAPVAPDAGQIVARRIPTPASCNGDGITTPTSDDVRPFATKYYDGKVYVGMVCSAQSMVNYYDPQNFTALNTYNIRSSMRAYVYTFDPTSYTFSAAPVLEFQLDYPRGQINDNMIERPTNDGEWLPWNDVWYPPYIPAQAGYGLIGNPQPMLTDIEFDGEGYMMLGFRDRWADQAYDGNDPGPNNWTTLRNNRHGGDVLLAYWNGSAWVLESAGSVGNRNTDDPQKTGNNVNAGPGNAEFYYAEYYDRDWNPNYHSELALGGLALLPGSGELASTLYDASVAFDNGTVVFKNDTGGEARTAQVYPANYQFGKAGGVGDLELLCNTAPLEIGNRVWRDTDGDGIQDPGEPAIANVTLELYSADGTLVASTTTDANGNYYFNTTSGLQPNTQYYIVVAAAELQSGGDLYGYSLTTPRNSAVNLRDSDAEGIAPVNLGDRVGVVYTTGPAGANDHSLDLGFRANVTLGNQVWFDDDNDGLHDRPVRVGDYVWFDLDGDSVQDAGESGVPGVRVTLYDNVTSRALRSTTTDAAGLYLFDNLPAGNYYVVFDLTTIPLGFSVVTPDQGGDDTLDSDANQSTGQTPPTGALALGQQNLTLDMGLTPTGMVAVGDRVWYDVDRDGIQDTGEGGVPGVRVELHPSSATDCTGTPLGTTATDEQGYYLFPGLPPAAYRVCFDLATLPSGYEVTLQNQGSDDALDSDADTTTGLTAATPALSAGQVDRSLDMGIRAANATTNSLGDRVWYDRDRDGIQDSGEGGVPGVRVELHPSGAACADMPLAVDVTDEFGNYLFPGLPDGSYFVCFELSTLPNGYEVTLQDQGGDDALDSDANPTTGETPSVALSGGTTNLTLDMGIRLASTSVVAVGDRVWLDADRDGVQDASEPGVPGVGVGLYLDGQSCVPGPTNNGGWTPAGQWAHGTPSFWITRCFDGSGCWGTNLTGNYNNSTTQDLVSVAFNVPAGSVAPIRVTWNHAYQLADAGDIASAWYRCNGGAWTQMWTQAGAATQTWITARFAGPTCTAGQTMQLRFRLVSDGAGQAAGYYVDGVSVRDNGSTLIYTQNFDPTPAATPQQQASTGADGYYLFDNLPAGNYFTCFDLNSLPSGYQVTTQNAGSDDTVDSDASATTGATASTGALSGGQVDLTLDMGICSINASSASLGDYVWYDRDRDGIQDAGEAGVEGVRVTLYLDAATDRAIASTTTDGTGRYLFTGLQPGTYYVIFDLSTLPAGYSVTLRDQGGDDAVDSDADTATGQTASVTLAAGGSNLTLDMGIVQAGTVRVGDRVWYDNDADGRQDPGEIGVPGVTVSLHRATATATCASTPLGRTVTGLDGRYLFAGLAPGSYFVCFDLNTLPAGYSLSPANNQLEDDVDSDADATGKTPPTGNLAAGEYDLTLDMGIYSTGNVTVGDYVWYDRDADGIQDAGESGVRGVTVELYRSTQTCNRDMPLAVTTTGADGQYLFSKLAAGNYFVCFDLDTLPAGYQVTLQDQGGDDAVDSDADPTTGATAATGQLNNGQSNLTLDMGIRQTAGGTVSVGDTVWYDDDRDGIQDSGEPGVPGVDVELHPSTNADCNATPQATTTTDGNGKYLFSGQTPGDYFVCFDLADLPTGFVVTAQNAGSDDGVDSDADPATGRTANTGALSAGQADLSLDMGIYPDTPVEPPIAGVTIYLFASGTDCAPDGSGAIATTSTDASGKYLFTGLPAGDYYVHVPASNFNPGGPLHNRATSTGNDPAPDPDDDTDLDDNGTAVTTGACAGGVSSGIITLGVGGEPTTDETDDRNVPNVSQNTTADLGFRYFPTAVTLASFTAAPDGQAIRLEWETASELDNAGFNLYRATSLNGDYVRLNNAVIASQNPGGVIGAAYNWTDVNVKLGVTYYYKLEDIDIHGVSTWHGPVWAALPGHSVSRLYLPIVMKNSR